MVSLAPRLRGILLVTTAAVVFSFSGLLVRLIDASGWTVVFWRCVFLVAGVSLYLLWRYGSRLPAMLRAGGWLLAAGGIGHAAGFTLFVLAIERASVANVVVIMSASPLVAALLARLLLGEPLARRTLVAMLAATAGIALMFWTAVGAGTIVGNLLAAGIAVAIGANIVVMRAAPGIDLIPVTVSGGVIGALVAAGAGAPLPVGWFELALLALMGLQLTLGLVLWIVGARTISAAENGLLTLLEVVLAPVWVWLVVAEVPHANALIGAAIVLAAVAWQTSGVRLPGFGRGAVRPSVPP